MTGIQSLVFANLVRSGTSIAELARRIGVTRQTMHETVRSIRDAGLVEIRADPTNRRRKLVVLTEIGQANVAAAAHVSADLERELSHRIGADRVAVLRDALEVD